jgi:hypothetical protein
MELARKKEGRRGTYGCGVQVHDTQIRIRITFRSINLDGTSDAHLNGLRQHKLSECMDVEFFGVGREELTEESLEGDAAGVSA